MMYGNRTHSIAQPAGGDMTQDPFTELHVTPDTPFAEVQRSWRALVREHHPDRIDAEADPEGWRAAHERLLRLNAAWEEIKRQHEVLARYQLHATPVDADGWPRTRRARRVQQLHEDTQQALRMLVRNAPASCRIDSPWRMQGRWHLWITAAVAMFASVLYVKGYIWAASLVIGGLGLFRMIRRFVRRRAIGDMVVVAADYLILIRDGWLWTLPAAEITCHDRPARHAMVLCCQRRLHGPIYAPPHRLQALLRAIERASWCGARDGVLTSHEMEQASYLRMLLSDVQR